MSKIIYYYDVANYLCKLQEKQMQAGVFNDKLHKKITKLFAWDYEKNLIC